MITYDEAELVKKQHKKPCSDCPFRRNASAGWLADKTPEEYVMLAHFDGIIECHTKKFKTGIPQCAGAAIYRANVLKRCREEVLELPKDKEKVFTSPIEFIEYHKKAKVNQEEVKAACNKIFENALDKLGAK